MSVKKELNSLERALKCAELALDKKAFDVRILEIARLSSIADYLVIATGTSNKQVQAIAESLRVGMKDYGRHIDIEGMDEGKWVVIDYGDILVHVFLEDVRRYYDLDGLWDEAPVVDIPEEFQWEGKGA
jgi:ribosome-associated protein